MTGEREPRMATRAQIAALRRFKCTIPEDLTFDQASAWMDHLTRILDAKKDPTDIDRAGPPAFETRKPLPPKENGSPGEIMPASDEWITVEVTREKKYRPPTGFGGVGKPVKESVTVRLATHAAPGETYAHAAARLHKIAAAEANADPSEDP